MSLINKALTRNGFELEEVRYAAPNFRKGTARYRLTMLEKLILEGQDMQKVDSAHVNGLNHRCWWTEEENQQLLDELRNSFPSKRPYNSIFEKFEKRSKA